MIVIKDINFIPDYVFQKSVKARKRALAILCSVIGFSLIVGLFIVPQGIYKFYEYKELKAREELVSLSSIKKKMSILADITSKKDKKEKVIRDVESNQKKITELMSTIYSGIPGDITVRSYSLTGKQLNMAFVITSPSDTVRLIDSLEKLGIFAKIEINNFPIVDQNYTINAGLTLK